MKRIATLDNTETIQIYIKVSMADKVKLVQLNSDQIAEAKKANGQRKQITHAVVCGEHGQLFGTEKQCRKYFSAWSEIFPYLFDGGDEIDNYEFNSFETTPELVMILSRANDALEARARKNDTVSPSTKEQSMSMKKKGWIAKILRRWI